jgi:hypothetical protein
VEEFERLEAMEAATSAAVHERRNGPPMLGDHYRLGPRQVDQGPNPCFASFAEGFHGDSPA